MRIAIIGAGIAGLTAAIALRRIGADVSIYERSPGPREVGAGISLWTNAFRALDYLDIGDTVRQHALAVTCSEGRTSRGHRMAMRLDIAAMTRSLGLKELVRILHRADLLAALASHVPAELIHFGHEVIGVEPSAAGARITFRHGNIEADAVIGADGIHSVVRQAILPPEPPRYSGYTCWRGVCPRPSDYAVGTIGEWWGRGRRLGIATISAERVYWFAVENAPQNRPVPNAVEHLTTAFAGWADPSAVLFRTTPPDAIAWNDIIDRPPTPTWSRGCIGLIGDAAHPTSPNMGQGGCLAIEDAIVLARQLAGAAEPGLALTRFTEERQARATAINRQSWFAGRVAHTENSILCAIRDNAMGLLGAVASPKRLFAHALFDVGPLETQGPAKAGPHERKRATLRDT